MVSLRFLSIFLLCAALSPRAADAAVTVSSGNAYTTRTTSSRTTFTWPIDSTSGINDNYCKFARTYLATRLSPISPGSLLSITVSSDVITTPTNTYAHAEITSGTSSLNIEQDSTGQKYAPYTGDDTTFTLDLSDLCSVTKAGTAGCQFTMTTNEPETQSAITIRVGVSTGQTQFCTTSTLCNTNGTATTDYTEVLFEFPRCATLDPVPAHGFFNNGNATPGVDADRYSYGLTASPGDGRAKLNLTFFPPVTGSFFPYKSVIYLLEESTTTRITPMSTGAAKIIREIPGDPSISSTTIDGLTNDVTYNAQVAFVNVGGFITTPGPPNGINGDISATAPQVRPSAVGGLLSEDACFIASAAEGPGTPIVRTLRLFRDHVLTRTAWGVKFVQWYYGWSPPRAQWLEQHPAWKPVIRAMLWPITAMAAAAVWVKTGPGGFILLVIVGIPLLFGFIAFAFYRHRGSRVILLAALGAATGGLHHADAAEVGQPYIDELKRDHEIEERSSKDPASQEYIDELKAKHGIEQVGPSKQPSEPYIEELSKTHGLERAHPQAEVSQPYIDSLLGKAGGSTPRKEGQPYIEALKSGKELEPKKIGTVHKAMGIVASTGGNLDVQAGSAQANSFDSVYRPTKKYNPTVDVYYEHHLIRDRIWGAFGPIARLGIVHARGTGRVNRSGAETDVKFQLLALPLSAGVSYRAIQPRFVVPFVQGAVVTIPFWETRDDDKPTRKGLAYSYSATVGVALSLDWLGRQNAWERYDDYGILHTYIVVQHQVLRPLFDLGRVDFKSSSTMAGLNFEF